MSRGFPSMTALLGVLAVAGYQNRNKLAELLAGVTGSNTRSVDPASIPRVQGGTAAVATNDGSIGAVLTDGIRNIIDHFRTAGHGDAADSWVAHGPNREITPQHLESAIGGDTLDALEKQTGLSRAEIVARLTRELPGAVDKCTPNGCLPA